MIKLLVLLFAMMGQAHGNALYEPVFPFCEMSNHPWIGRACDTGFSEGGDPRKLEANLHECEGEVAACQLAVFASSGFAEQNLTEQWAKCDEAHPSKTRYWTLANQACKHAAGFKALSKRDYPSADTCNEIDSLCHFKANLKKYNPCENHYFLWLIPTYTHDGCEYGYSLE